MQQLPPERQAVIQNALKHAGPGSFFKVTATSWTLEELLYAEDRVGMDVVPSLRQWVLDDLARVRAELLDAERDLASEKANTERHRESAQRNEARHQQAIAQGKETLNWAKIAGWAAIVSILLSIVALCKGH